MSTWTKHNCSQQADLIPKSDQTTGKSSKRSFAQPIPCYFTIYIGPCSTCLHHDRNSRGDQTSRYSIAKPDTCLLVRPVSVASHFA